MGASHLFQVCRLYFARERKAPLLSVCTACTPYKAVAMLSASHIPLLVARWSSPLPGPILLFAVCSCPILQLKQGPLASPL